MRNTTKMDMVRQFMGAMGQPVDVTWSDYLTDLALLRYRLVKEEAEEVDGAIEPDEILKELADLLYVAYGFAASYGWDLDTAYNRVHQSNMSKLGDDGKPVYRADGKVLKSKNYKKPYIRDLV